MSDEQKQLIRKDVRDMVMTKYGIFHAFKHPEINGEIEMESLIELLESSFINEIDSAIKQTEERMVEKIKKNDLCLYSGDVDSIITLIRNK